MGFKIKITCGLKDTTRNLSIDDYLPEYFIPRIGDTIIWKNLYWDVYNVVIDYSDNEIRVYVKDSDKFK